MSAAQLKELDDGLARQFAEPSDVAQELVRRGWLTPFQVDQLLLGKGDSLVLGAYVLLERLGEGGMGAVYRARHGKLGRDVALKVIRPERVSNPAAVRRFRREVQAASQLSHPNIVLAYDAGEENGSHFLVMACVAGRDLGKLVKASRLPAR